MIDRNAWRGTAEKKRGNIRIVHIAFSLVCRHLIDYVKGSCVNNTP